MPNGLISITWLKKKWTELLANPLAFQRTPDASFDRIAKKGDGRLIYATCYSEVREKRSCALEHLGILNVHPQLTDQILGSESYIDTSVARKFLNFQVVGKQIIFSISEILLNWYRQVTIILIRSIPSE